MFPHVTWLKWLRKKRSHHRVSNRKSLPHFKQWAEKWEERQTGSLGSLGEKKGPSKYGLGKEQWWEMPWWTQGVASLTWRSVDKRRNASVRLNDVNDSASGRHPTIYLYIFFLFFFCFWVWNNWFCLVYCFWRFLVFIFIRLGLDCNRNRENRENY